MQIGMIGLGRMGANMVRRLLKRGHTCVVYDRNHQMLKPLEVEGVTPARSLDDLTRSLDTPRVVWMMLPAAVVDPVLEQLVPFLQAGDIVIDGGNSYYKDDIKRANQLAGKAIHYVDVGVSGGVHGLERGYCLMAGGEQHPVRHIDPVLSALAPGLGDIPRTADQNGAPSTAEEGYLHCGPPGAGHFVKMVHNGIEYAMMAAYAEGLNLLRHADTGQYTERKDAETAPLRHPGDYQYQFDLKAISEVWRRGSVISSWLLDLTAAALFADQKLDDYTTKVSDSGEGRWTSIAAIETGTPAPVLTTALYERFSSRGESDFANRLLSAMRHGFGGHPEK